jgi:hypothetical protein
MLSGHGLAQRQEIQNVKFAIMSICLKTTSNSTPALRQTELRGDEYSEALQSDLYLSRHPGSTVWAIKNGTPAVYVDDEYKIFGYKHTLEFAHNVYDSIHNRSFEQNLAHKVKLPYTDWWYKQEINSLMTQPK